MSWGSILPLAALAVVIACAPPVERPAATAAEAIAEAAAADRDAILSAVTSSVARDLGQSVQMRIDTLKVQDGWAWVIGAAQTPAGAPVDWATTKHADAAAAGMLDGDLIHLLLQKQAAGWAVRDFAVAPADVAWADWPKEYGAPPELFGAPAP